MTISLVLSVASAGLVAGCSKEDDKAGDDAGGEGEGGGGGGGGGGDGEGEGEDGGGGEGEGEGEGEANAACGTYCAKAATECGFEDLGTCEAECAVGKTMIDEANLAGLVACVDATACAAVPADDDGEYNILGYCLATSGCADPADAKAIAMATAFGTWAARCMPAGGEGGGEGEGEGEGDAGEGEGEMPNFGVFGCFNQIAVDNMVACIGATACQADPRAACLP